jgi:hypothetical protein
VVFFVELVRHELGPQFFLNLLPKFIALLTEYILDSFFYIKQINMQVKIKPYVAFDIKSAQKRLLHQIKALEISSR